MEPSVAVVILNWNGQHFLAQFLPSVVKSSYSNLQIIVADNASTDQSVDFVREHFPEIQIILNRENLGFAEGYNQALRNVSADYFILLNSDVEVPENWIKPVVEFMETSPRIAAAQPKIKQQQNKSYFEYAGAAGGFLDTYGYAFCRGRVFGEVEQDQQQYNTNIPIFWASGAAFFIKSKVWKEMEGFDGDLFAHMEEIDLCWRLKNRGYEIYCVAEAEVYHVGGGTLNAGSPYKSYLNFRNNLFIMQKNLPFGEAFGKIFLRIWLDLLAWFQFILQGKWAFAFAINKAHTHFFIRIFNTSAKRTGRQNSLSQHSGVLKKSIVWLHFIAKKKKFSELENL